MPQSISQKWVSVLMTALMVIAFVTPISEYQSVSAAQQGPQKQFTPVDIRPEAIPYREDPGAEPYHYDPPPGLQMANAAGSSFIIHFVPAGGTNYLGDSCLAFPESAKTAYNAAAQIWSNLLVSSVPITIQACWANLPPGVLGHSAPSNYYTGDDGVLYPQALANALSGIAQSTEDDMSIAYGNSFTSQFYYGTDGYPPLGQIDFMSVVMHEIAHGLGFMGTMYVSGSTGQGQWGWGLGKPLSYDQFARDSNGYSLINTSIYSNPSYALGNALKSPVYFAGPNAMQAYGGSPVPLFTPSTWMPGSSYSHLDYYTFNGTPNSLMVYAIGAGSSIHDPGPVGLGVLRDIGWNTFIPNSAPGAFNKSTPTDGADSVPISASLSWSASSEATSYTYCYDTIDNDTCDGDWKNAGSSTSVSNIPGLVGSTTYYWQVRATNSLGSVDANSGAWWSFTTSPKEYVYLPLVSYEKSYSGTVLNDSTPLAGITVKMAYSTDYGSTWTPNYASTTTNSQGIFTFPSTPEVGNGKQFAVYYNNSTDDSRYLWYFECNLIDSSSNPYSCTINLRDIVITSPGTYAQVGPLVNFIWNRRVTTTDNYAWYFYNPSTQTYEDIIDNLGYISSINVDFCNYETNHWYYWGIDVATPYGYGMGYDYRQILFTSMPYCQYGNTVSGLFVMKNEDGRKGGTPLLNWLLKEGQLAYPGEK